MNILNILKEKFDIVTPIFERDILVLGYSVDDINETLEENVFERVKTEVQGFDFGNIYSLVEYNKLFNMYFKCEGITSDDIELFFTGIKNKFGYRCGFSALNLIGLSNQVCCSREIKSILVESVKVIDLGNCSITVKPLQNTYNSSEVLYYMFADAIDNYRNYFDCDLDLVKRLVVSEFKLDYNILFNYIRNKEVFYEIFK